MAYIFCSVEGNRTVTAVSDKKTRNAIRRAQKLNPDAAVGVCGCYAQLAADQVRALGADVYFRINDRGRIYGVTFIDHRSGIVVNGSRLGKAYSANVFADWFGATKSQRQDL